MSQLKNIDVYFIDQDDFLNIQLYLYTCTLSDNSWFITHLVYELHKRVLLNGNTCSVHIYIWFSTFKSLYFFYYTIVYIIVSIKHLGLHDILYNIYHQSLHTSKILYYEFDMILILYFLNFIFLPFFYTVFKYFVKIYFYNYAIDVDWTIH